MVALGKEVELVAMIIVVVMGYQMALLQDLVKKEGLVVMEGQAMELCQLSRAVQLRVCLNT